MTAATLRMLVAAAVAIALLLAAWTAVRLWRARDALRRVRDVRQAEDALRAQAEAILASRLARGEILPADYERVMERLWTSPVAAASAAGDRTAAGSPR